jgi:uncharacterized protein YciI
MIYLQGRRWPNVDMIYIVLFTDNPGRADQRQRFMADHLAFLEKNGARIRAAGPLKETGGAPGGGLWLVEAGSVAEVTALTREDPFWPTGLRESVRILEWTRVFAEGRRLIG